MAKKILIWLCAATGVYFGVVAINGVFQSHESKQFATDSFGASVAEQFGVTDKQPQVTQHEKPAKSSRKADPPPEEPPPLPVPTFAIAAPVVSPEPAASAARSTPAAVPANLSFSGGSSSQSQPAASAAVTAQAAAPAPVPVPPAVQIQFSAETASSSPPAAVVVPTVSSTPDTSFVCTPDPEAATPTQPVASHLLISELFIDMDGADTAEFVELYNPTDQSVNLASSSLQYLSSSSSGIDKISKKNFTLHSSIAAKGFYLIGTGDYAGTGADMTWSQALGNAGATVFLVGNTEPITGAGDSDIIDRIAYGTGALLLGEGTSVTLPQAGQSLGRKNMSVDTDNNSVDFAPCASPTPRATNL